MASLANDPGGRRRIQFVDADGLRKTIRLGKMSKRQAEAVKLRVEDLAAAQLSGGSPSDETSRWLANIDNGLREKLTSVGLAEFRTRKLLGEYVREYIQGRTDVKPNTLAKWRTSESLLISYFGASTKVDSITPGDVDCWRRELAETRSENTVRKHIAVAKVFFNAAVRQRIILESPFHDQKATILPNNTRSHFITTTDAKKVLEACPDAEWRLIFVLSRWGGLRCPSETLALRWGDVDWDLKRIRIKATKTEHHVGRGFRYVPIFPQLQKHLEDAIEQAEEGAEYVISRYRGSHMNLRTTMSRIIERSGLAVWPKLFQNLRSTRQTELEAEFPLHVVCAWLGNSERVARRHYLQVTDEHFAKAVAVDAAQNAAQSVHAHERSQPQPQGEIAKKTVVLQHGANMGIGVHPDPIAEAGLEPARGLPPTGF